MAKKPDVPKTEKEEEQKMFSYMFPPPYGYPPPMPPPSTSNGGYMRDPFEEYKRMTKLFERMGEAKKRKEEEDKKKKEAPKSWVSHKFSFLELLALLILTSTPLALIEMTFIHTIGTRMLELLK